MQCPVQVLGPRTCLGKKVKALDFCPHQCEGGLLYFPLRPGQVLLEGPSQNSLFRGEESLCHFFTHWGCQSDKQRCCHMALLRSSLN